MQPAASFIPLGTRFVTLPCAPLQAIEFYTEMGRIGMAARNLKEVAETQEKQGARDEAVVFWDQAAELFESDHQTSEGTKCRLKVGKRAAASGLSTWRRQILAQIKRRLAQVGHGCRPPLLRSGIAQGDSGRPSPASRWAAWVSARHPACRLNGTSSSACITKLCLLSSTLPSQALCWDDLLHGSKTLPSKTLDASHGGCRFHHKRAGSHAPCSAET